MEISTVLAARSKIARALDDLDHYPNPRQNGHVSAKRNLLDGIDELIVARLYEATTSKGD